ncbi:MAG: DUF5668 domain-containing protein [Anaerolineae bacterium]|nr:DUF5668 domain-containing protein [Anaerolineae bacterium]
MSDQGLRIYGTEDRSDKEQRWRRPGLFGPILLITAGVLLLLSNLGLLRVGWWELWRLWPLLLVFVGLDILSRHSGWASAAVIVLTLALVGWAVYVLCVRPQPARPLFAVGGDMVAHQVTESLAGATEVEVDLRMSVGELRLSALTDSPHLLQAELSYPERGGAMPHESYTVSNGRGRLLIESRREVAAVPFIFQGGGERWTLALSPEVPLSIRLRPGASSSVLDLSRLRLQQLDVEAGVGRLEVLFPAEGVRMRARIEGGAAEVVLRVPQGLAARLEVEGGLRSTQIGSRFSRVGDAYETAGFAGAESRLEIVVEGGVGVLRVE